MKRNKTLMQYFEWYLTKEDELWKKVAIEAKKLAKIGVTDVWLPPAFKSAGGDRDTGYAVYDLYDLGEFDQKGTIKTKYGSKDEYLAAIEELHQNGIKVYADIVLNHKMGADATEEIYATEDEQENRNIENGKLEKINAWTKYTFPGRNNKYSDFKWNYSHFAGADWDERSQRNGIFRFCGRRWADDVDSENGNYAYLMGADIDHESPVVRDELKKWGKWYLDFTKVDNVRLDAVKHISFGFMKEWIRALREDRQIDCVGEYWNRNMDAIRKYINGTEGTIPLFDVPLHYNLFEASTSGENYDMSKIFENTLVNENPDLSVTFVDNHDTQPGQALSSWVEDWFKEIAYSLILLRKYGLPCVFYGDYYGISNQNVSAKNEMLDRLLKIRNYFAYGEEIDYFDNNHVIAFVRQGDEEHKDSGLATIMSNSRGGSKRVNVGNRLARNILYDITGNVKDTITVDENGDVDVYCNGGSVSVWVKKENIYI